MLSFIHLLSSILVSILVWFVIGMILFGPGIGIVGTDLFGPVNAPVSKLLLAALAAGVIQGSLLRGHRHQIPTPAGFLAHEKPDV